MASFELDGPWNFLKDKIETLTDIRLSDEAAEIWVASGFGLFLVERYEDYELPVEMGCDA